MSLKLNTKYLEGFVSGEDLGKLKPETEKALSFFYENKSSAPGNDFHGWRTLPEDYDKKEFAEIKAAAEKIRNDSDILIVIGIGGSYLGARAVIEFCKSKNYNLLPGTKPQIFFLGNSLSPTEITEVLSLTKDKDFSVNVISKSGTTTEPSVAFRIFKRRLVEKYGEKQANERIYVTTDRSKGILRREADENSWKSFVIPDDVGGRYSVLTAVGLLPIACAGIDIDKLMKGARDAMNDLKERDVEKNQACRYAAIRNILLRKGKFVEMMVCYEPDYTMMNEWFKQLFGESEGKENKGILPYSGIYSTDLHSLGQYVQEGERILFETLVSFKEPKCDITIEKEENNGDGLNFLAGRTLSYVNKTASQGVILAHTDGSVPNIILELDRMDEENLGYLIYFLEFSCGVSGYILGVNPFNQPGVEAYKKNMFALLGKPGYESQTEKLRARL